MTEIEWWFNAILIAVLTGVFSGLITYFLIRFFEWFEDPWR
jgi:hypothetical protein